MPCEFFPKHKDCRRRLEKELGGTERAKRARKKVDEYVKKTMEENEATRKERIDAKNMKSEMADDKMVG